MTRWVPFEWIAALRFLREGKWQTLSIIAGVAIGVGVIVFMSAMLASLQGNFITRVLASQPHIQIIPPEEAARPLRAPTPGVVYAAVVQRPTQRLRSIDQWQAIVQQVRANPDVREVTATVTSPALASRGDASRSITVTGIDPATYFAIVRLPDYIVRGAPRLASDDIIIGTDLARELGVSVGDRVSVTAAGGQRRPLSVSALFDIGNKAANERLTYVALRTGQSLANLTGGVTSIDITVTDIYTADVVATAIAASTRSRAESWISTNGQLFSTLSAQGMSFTTIRFFVGLSVAFGIASVLIVTVIQRSKDIGILRAMGASQRQVLRVFLLQGGVLGIAGAVLGAGLGAGALKVFHTLVRLPNGDALFPFAIEPQMVAVSIAIAAVSGVLAAALPAVTAARLDPVVAIRG